MSKASVIAGWSDVPHLDEGAKRELSSSYLPHELDARTKGTPSLGAGAIYPVALSEILVDPFEIPIHWKHVYGLDVGWNRTAAVWAAHDEGADVLYLVSEHYRGQAEPAIHSEAINARGKWIPGVIDPAANGRSQHDGERLMTTYVGFGLTLRAADNAVETGIYAVWSRLSTGRLKVFRNLQNWQIEYRVYRRDEKGRIVKENDHLMDATRYLCVSGVKIAAFKPRELRVDKGKIASEYDPFREVNESGRYAPAMQGRF